MSNNPGNLPKMQEGTAEKTKKVQKEVDDVTKIMQKNVQDAMERGERLDDLEKKTAALEEGSKAFTKSSKTVKKNLFWKNMKYWMYLIIAIVLLVLVILFATNGSSIVGKIFGG